MTITSAGQRAYVKVEEANMADHDVDQPLIRDLLDRVGSLVDLGVTVDRSARDQLIMDLVDMVHRLERQASLPARPFGTGSTMRRRLMFYRDTVTDNHSDAYERANRPGAPL